MLIRCADIEGRGCADLRIDQTQIIEIAPRLVPQPDEIVIDARGGALFPGLHDHHIHLAAYAASLASVCCGPPDVHNPEELAATLALQETLGTDWLRGTGYHESVAGRIDRAFLDRYLPTRPARIQHRSGRLWIFNSAALDLLKPEYGDPLERAGGRLTGLLYDADEWLRAKLKSRFPSLADASRNLARWGVTGITDATVSNGPAELAHFRAAAACGELLQDFLLMGDDRLQGVPRKFHLHESSLPDFVETVGAIRAYHAAGRVAAFHCVTRVDLAFAMAALMDAGTRDGDRIEHAAVVPPELATLMRSTGVAAITQPNFIFERGDTYRIEVPAEDQPWLYRARGLLDLGIPLAAGADAPFGAADPWALMAAAVSRKTRSGHVIGANEALTPEEAIGLYLGSPERPGGARRGVCVGAPADLVLLDRPWAESRELLSAVVIQATLRAGAVIFNR